MNSYKYYSKEYWQSQIAKALAWRKKKGREERWDDITRYYEHRFEQELEPRFNLIYMLANSLVPSLVFSNPHVINTARRPDFQYWATFFDGIDNLLIDELEIQTTLEEAVLQCFLYNTVGLHLGYDFAETNDVEDELVFKPLRGVLDRSRKTNQPWIDLITPDKLILAPGTKTIRNCRWFGKFLCLPTRVLKKRKDFINVVVTEVPDEIAKKEGNKWLESERENEGYTSFYELHDAETGKMFCIDTKGNFILRPVIDPCQVDGLPLEVLTFNSGANSIWGTPDSLYIESQFLEGNECRKDGRLQRRAAIVKAFYDKNLLSEEDVIKYLEGDPMMMIGVDLPPDKKLSDLIVTIQPHVQMELFETQKQLLNDAQLIVGNGPNQFGTFAPGRRTKYETQVVEERNLLRTGSRRQKVADTLGVLVSRMNQLIVRYWKAPIIVRVLGRDAGIYWVKGLPSEFKEIQQQLVTKVNVESLTPTSRERRKQEMMELLQIIPKFQGTNFMPLLQNFLSAFDWADVSKILPQLNNNPMSMQEFQTKQNAIQKDPNYMQTLQNNLGGMSKLIGKLPSMGEAQ